MMLRDQIPVYTVDELLYKWVAFPILKMEERTLMTKSLDQ